MRKNNFVNNEQTDKNCQYPADVGLKRAMVID